MCNNMAVESRVPIKIYELIRNVSKGDIEDYTLVVHDKNKKGEGFMGEMCYASLMDKNGNKSMHYAIKQAFVDNNLRETFPVRGYFLNEICFYTKVWPHFQKFQADRSLKSPFDSIPKCYTTSSEEGHEKIVLENLTYKDFQIFNKKEPFDQKHVEYVLKRYGKLHALSFAYKKINPHEFHEITKGLVNFFSNKDKFKLFEGHMKYVFETALCGLDPQKHSKLVEKFRPQADHLLETFCDRNIYKGDYSIVLHGDCWSNNLMFKYNDSKELVDIKLLDFQLSKLGTPVIDLSYFLYSGVPGEILSDLDHYLKVYHNSLSATLEEFGLDGSLYPLEVLKQEWKEYSVAGFIAGLAIWRAKATYDDSVKDFTDMEEQDMSVFQESKFDEDSFQKRSGDLLLHMYENDFF